MTAGGKDGKTAEKALNGIHSKLNYQTPLEFFAGLTETEHMADTAAKSRWVLNKDNEAKQVVASGIRIHLPKIEGTGKLRIRYPIMPLHYEGTASWKELTAIKVSLCSTCFMLFGNLFNLKP